MSASKKTSGISAGDVLLYGGVGIGALFLVKSLTTPKPVVQAAPAPSGGGFLSSLFGALTGAGQSVAGAAQSAASPGAPIDPSQLPPGAVQAAQSAGSAISSFFGNLFGSGTPSPAATDAHEAAHASPVSGLSYELGSLGGTVFDNPTLPMRRGRMIPPGMTGRVPGRGARRYR